MWGISFGLVVVIISEKMLPILLIAPRLSQKDSLYFYSGSLQYFVQ